MRGPSTQVPPSSFPSGSPPLPRVVLPNIPRHSLELMYIFVSDCGCVSRLYCSGNFVTVRCPVDITSHIRQCKLVSVSLFMSFGRCANKQSRAERGRAECKRHNSVSLRGSAGCLYRLWLGVGCNMAWHLRLAGCMSVLFGVASEPERK